MVVQVLLLILLVSVGLSDHGDWPAPSPSSPRSSASCSWVRASSSWCPDARPGPQPRPDTRPRDGSVLIERGAFGWSAPPLRRRIVLAVGWGLVAASLTTLLLAGLLGLFFDLKSRREEAWLSARYPAYPAYAARTRKLIPWVY